MRITIDVDTSTLGDITAEDEIGESLDPRYVRLGVAAMLRVLATRVCLAYDIDPKTVVAETDPKP